MVHNLVEVDIVQNDLTTLIQDLVERTNKAITVRLIFQEIAPENRRVLTTTEKTELFYIVQEALQNAMKHGYDKQYYIFLDWTNGLLLEVESIGAINSGDTPGSGIHSMVARAERINATFSIANNFGKVVVSVRL